MSVELHSPKSIARPSAAPDLHANAALATLFAPALASLKPHLRHREFHPGRTLWDTDGPDPALVYFPLSGVISVQCLGFEVASIGREAVAYSNHATHGIALTHGMLASVPATVFASLARNNEEIADIAARSHAWLLTQAQHLAVCNRLHRAEARVCRWLLGVADRTEDPAIVATQNDIGTMLGLRRTTVTMIAQELRTRQMIGYRRTKIRIHNREQIAAAACDCCKVLGPANWPFRS